MTLGVADNHALPPGGPTFTPTLPSQVGAIAVAYRPFGLFRMALAVMVMMHHFGIHLASIEASLVFRRLDLGRVAVLVFFILSGFVISEAAETFYARRPAAFACNRLLRIMPPFFGAIILSYVVQLGLFEAGWLHPLEGERVNASDFTPLALIMNLLAIMPGARLLGELPDYLLIRYVWAVRIEVLFYLDCDRKLSGLVRCGPSAQCRPRCMACHHGSSGLLGIRDWPGRWRARIRAVFCARLQLILFPARKPWATPYPWHCCRLGVAGLSNTFLLHQRRRADSANRNPGPLYWNSRLAF